MAAGDTAVPASHRLLAAAAMLAAAVVPAPLAAIGWSDYAARFVAADGRVVDDGNGGISHSEGQGFGLLLAVGHGDRARFDRIRDWTWRHLGVRDDRLFAWRWDPAQGGVTDRNNATDGDLLIAWAHVRAAARWNEQRFRADAAQIAMAIRERLVRRDGERAWLLPGAVGFEHGSRLTLNPSYYVQPAFAALNAVDPDPVWGALAASGLHLVRTARFGASGLPPDWIDVAGGRIEAPADRPLRFGFEAIRVPLYLAWSGIAVSALDRALARHFAPGAATPAWRDLEADLHADHGASAGFLAVARLAAGAPPDLDGGGADYYAASLVLLAGLAYRDAAGR
ncbi:MAG: endoglucanase [Alphaproteobacteria bacterium]|nr:endoglucanase [Alphaproteobacteria bacterium]